VYSICNTFAAATCTCAIEEFRVMEIATLEGLVYHFGNFCITIKHANLVGDALPKGMFVPYIT
jgi:hypothetical protein